MPDEEQAPKPFAATCPHCRQPLESVGWTVNPQAGLVTFYHNAPTCLCALNCQFVQVQAQETSRIQLPSEFRPRGLG